MVGQWTVTKPSRSDEVLDAGQQLQIFNQIRAQFDSLAPKRPTKPNRSEPDTTPTNPSPVFSPEDHQNIPELHKFRSLQSQSHVIVTEQGATMVGDEFVETQYYKELDSIDKEHHMTGSGFIKVVREGSEENGYGLEVSGGSYGDGQRPTYRSNPATNDWIPRVDQDQAIKSSKPNRSEGC